MMADERNEPDGRHFPLFELAIHTPEHEKTLLCACSDWNQHSAALGDLLDSRG
jgi:hypothetical protein